MSFYHICEFSLLCLKKAGLASRNIAVHKKTKSLRCILVVSVSASSLYVQYLIIYSLFWFNVHQQDCRPRLPV